MTFYLIEFNGNYGAILYRFEILSLIFQKLKRPGDNDHAPFGDSLSSIGWDLLCSTQVSTFTCNEDTKCNAKCKKKSRFVPLFEVTHRVHLWLDGKCIVDFMLAIIELFSPRFQLT